MTMLTITLSSNERDALQRLIEAISDAVSNCVFFTKIYEENGLHQVTIKVDEPVDELWFADISTISATLRSHWQHDTGRPPAFPRSIEVVAGLTYAEQEIHAQTWEEVT